MIKTFLWWNRVFQNRGHFLIEISAQILGQAFIAEVKTRFALIETDGKTRVNIFFALENDGLFDLFLQFAEELEEDILKGIFEEESQIPSTTEVAVKFKINPATANRGVNLLVDEGIIYKKRGIGMFVATGARERIASKRRNAFYESYILPLVNESKNLDLTKNEIMNMVEKGYGKWAQSRLKTFPRTSEKLKP